MNPNEFIEHYEKYLLGDIDAMMEKADQKDEQGKLGNQMAVPIALSIFAALDIFGFLIRYIEAVDTNVVNEIKDSTVNIANSMLWSDFGFPAFEIQNVPRTSVKNRTKNQYFIDFQATALYKLIDIYRHGMAHTFFPKSFTISNAKDYELLELLLSKNGVLIFNVRKFHLNFNDFLTKFKRELASDLKFYQIIEENINRSFKIESTFDEFSAQISAIPKFNESFHGENNTTLPETTSLPH